MIKVILILLLSPLILFSQKEDRIKDAPKTKLEEFSLKAGEIIKKEYIRIDEIENLTISFLTISDNNNNVTKGVYLSGKVTLFSGSLASTSTYRTEHLDGDEIDDLIQFLKLIKDHVDKKGPDYETEFHYRSRSGFRAYLYSIQGSLGNKAVSWKFGFDFTSYSTSSSLEFKNKSIDQLISAFEKAKSML